VLDPAAGRSGRLRRCADPESCQYASLPLHHTEGTCRRSGRRIGWQARQHRRCCLRRAMTQFPQPDVASLWRDTAPAPLEPERLEGEVQADVAIIGGGYTGLSTAHALTQQGTDVVVLEANRLGWGASGRNGGVVSGKF